ncbi:MAG TPA: shikimate dehydrogenase [Tessaracoccus flavescens]|uniref:Shikimate dehydrogenase n=1 Tax=Tessaracoccus flavescens TaxID=399497 RepID=A0A921EN52_9ACTN|nr:shikimate dehydrogenase [Tessaracoccus flavescens]
MLTRAGVVGDPAAHSLSPAIHRAGYEAHGLSWDYQAYTVAPESLADFVQSCAADETWAGLSVTAPHKEAVLAFGEADEPTRLLGAGNTLVFGDAPRVYNTDVPGFVRAWRAHVPNSPSAAAIVGNGATARSITLALAGLGTAELIVLARRPERAKSLADLAATLGMSVDVRVLGEPLEPVDLVANTIPAHATTAAAPALAEAARVVFDVVYDPWPTPLGEAAERAGRQSLSGMDLLAGQAVDQFFLLTGKHITFEQARSAAGRELRRRSAV